MAPSVENKIGPTENIEKHSFGNLDCHLLVFIDGQYHSELSSINGLPAQVMIWEFSLMKEIHPKVREYLLQNSAKKENAFTALNDAFLNQVAVLYVPDNISPEKACSHSVP